MGTKRERIQQFCNHHRRTLLSLLAMAVCFAVCFAVWAVAVRGQGGKSLSEKLSDDYSQSSAPIRQSVSQSFTWDGDVLAVGFVFGISGQQPAGTLDLTLSDADTGETLAVSTGDMANIVAGQYTGLGLDHTVAGQAGRHYLVTLMPQYTGDGRLTAGCSTGATLLGETFLCDGQTSDSTLALLLTYRQIGGFLSRFYWVVALGILLAAGLSVRLALAQKLRLHRAAFVMILLFGVLFNLVLPPYSAPDEEYHINQSFTLACKWANVLSADEWRMGKVPLESSFRRETDTNALVQDSNTTVFTWQEVAGNLLSTTDVSFDSHLSYPEAQTDNNPTLYLPSAAAVFLCFVLHLGFVPALLAGRLANLLLFAALAALAVKKAPFGKRIFFVCSLLPMTLHLAASFSRDGPLLGLCFAFTALCLDAAFGQSGNAALPLRKLALPALLGLLIAPVKVVYLPLVFLCCLIPAARLGRRSRLLKGGFLAACLVLALAANHSVLSNALTAVQSGSGSAAPDSSVSADSGQSAPAEEDAVQSLSFACSAAGTAQAQTLTSECSAAQDGIQLCGVSAETSAPDSDFLQPDTAQTEALAANTVEGFVRRLYYYGENTLDEPDSEVAFWVQALQDHDVSAALLGQSFFFSPARMAADAPDSEMFHAISMAFWMQDATADETRVAALRSLMQDYGMESVYKYIYTDSATHTLLDPLGVDVGADDIDRFPLERSELSAAVEAARAVRSKQSIATGADAVCYTPGYLLHHLPAAAALVVRSALENGDQYFRTLVGGSLSYNSLDLAWVWVVLLYLLLAYAALPVSANGLPGGARLGAGLAALASALLIVAGCITWTPTYYTTIYGLQGRYFLPLLPLALGALRPRRALVQAQSGTCKLMIGIAFVDAGVLLNCMIAVIAR